MKSLIKVIQFITNKRSNHDMTTKQIRRIKVAVLLAVPLQTMPKIWMLNDLAQVQHTISHICFAPSMTMIFITDFKLMSVWCWTCCAVWWCVSSLEVFVFDQVPLRVNYCSKKCFGFGIWVEKNSLRFAFCGIWWWILR